MIRTIGKERLLLVTWLFTMMALPNTSTVIKFALMFSFVLCVLACKKVSLYSVKGITAVLIWELLFIFEQAYSCARGYAFNFTLFEIYLIRPPLLFMMASYFKEKQKLHFLFDTLILLTAFILLYNVIFILQGFGIVPVLIREERAHVGHSSYAIIMRSSNLTALMFLNPFLTALYFERRLLQRKRQKLICVMFYISIIIAALSGRRALQLITGATIGLFVLRKIVHSRQYTKDEPLKLIFVAIAFLATVIIVSNKLGYDIVGAVLNTVSEPFKLGDVGGGKIRMIQIKALFIDWIKDPILGRGLASNSHEYTIKTGRIQTLKKSKLLGGQARHSGILA